MADETVVTGTGPASPDTAKAATQTDTVNHTGEVSPDVKATETGEPKTTEQLEKKADPQKSELAYLKRKLARQEREREALLERLITAQQPRTEQREAEPKISDFDEIGKFLDARDQWKSRQTETRTTKAEGPPQAYIQAVNEARSDLMTAGTEKYENFEDLVSSDDNKITVPMRDAIFDIENLDTQVDVTWFLANNPKEQIRISRLSPARQIKEIDRLESKLKSQPTKKVSAAPAPIEPVGGKETRADPLESAKSDAEWIRAREAELKKRRRG